MVNAMRAIDGVTIGLLHRIEGTELTAHTWPKAPPENRHPTFLRLLSGLMVSYAGDRRMGVARDDGHVSGMVIARSRATGVVWDIEQLVAPSVGAAVDLLGWACECARNARGRRVFLETPPEGLGADAARRAGFERYSDAATYRLEPGFRQDAPDALPARPRLTSDEQGVFQLYCAAVPAPVRAAEAMTYGEWKALYRGRKVWTPSVLGSRQDFVWELGSRIIGWMRLSFGQRSQYLEMLVHPLYESYTPQMIRNALSQMSAKVPVLADVREYHAGIRNALEQEGFRSGAAYTIWVRQLAPRLAQPSGAAAQATA